jgi:hypothetical protein
MSKPLCYVGAMDKYMGGTMSARAEYYSGNGVSSYDLGPDKLEKFYNGFKADFGDEVALNFCRFIENLEDISASGFICAFERWFAYGMGTKVEQNSTDWVAVGPDTGDGSRETVALLGVFGAISRDHSRDRAMGENIKTAFFARVGYQREKPLPAREREHEWYDPSGHRFYRS